MSGFFAAGAAAILFTLGPNGVMAFSDMAAMNRKLQDDNTKGREEIKVMEEEAKRLRNVNGEEVDLLIREHLQRQRKDELRLKPADPPAKKDQRTVPVLPPAR
ncbi:MAG: hypothetical protein QM813_00685 [Verrucomicrobiota bacterium]